MSTPDEVAPYVSPNRRHLFIARKAAAVARRYDEQVVYWIQQGMDLASARDMADASDRYDWSPEDQSDLQADSDRAIDDREWTKS